MRIRNLWFLLCTLSTTASAVELPWKEIRPPTAKKYLLGRELRIALFGTPEEKTAEYRKRCEAKLGPLPDLSQPEKTRLYVLLNKRKVVPDPKTNKPMYQNDNGSLEPVEEEYIGSDGNLKVCDNPSLAGQVETCNFKAVQYLATYPSKKENVYWVAILRENENTSNGLIGWNEENGASCYFAVIEGKKDPEKEKTYTVKRPGGDNCTGCHTQSDPFNVTPYVKDAWDPLGVPRQMKGHRIGNYHSHVPGIEFSGLQPASVVLEVTHHDGTANTTCTRCHQVATFEDTSFYPFMLRDALGQSMMAGNHEEAREAMRLLGFRPPHWMPQGGKKTADATEAVDAILAFVHQKQHPALKVKPIHDCEKIKTALGKASGIDEKPRSGEQTLRWRLDGDRDAALAPHITFEVCARARDDKHRMLGVVRFVPSGTRGDDGRWELRHSLPPADGVATIEYTITPIFYSPDHLDCPLVVGESVYVDFPAAEAFRRNAANTPVHSGAPPPR